MPDHSAGGRNRAPSEETTRTGPGRVSSPTDTSPSTTPEEAKASRIPVGTWSAGLRTIPTGNRSASSTRKAPPNRRSPGPQAPMGVSGSGHQPDW